MKRKSLWLALVAVVLVAAMGIAPAWAYFTDTSTASGNMKVNVIPKTDITDDFDEGVKSVTITNDEDASAPVFVRARVYYAAANFKSASISADGWTPDGDWYIYDEAVEPGDATSPLKVAVEFWTEQDGVVVGDNYNIVVVYESVPAQYNADGTPNYNDWKYILDSGTSTQSGGE